jgi:phosphopantetheine--protein transferase-like protein
MFSCGIDIVKVSRFYFLIEKYSEKFLNRLFSKEELNYCKGKSRFVECLAGKFAAKEAVIKALRLTGVALRDIQILNVEGRPIVYIKGEMHSSLDVSISHDGDYAVAACICGRCNNG